jgi:hypothetical protein
VAPHLRGSLRDVDFRDFCGSSGNKSSSDGSARAETMARALTSSQVMDTTCIKQALSSAAHLRMRSWVLSGLCNPLLFGSGEPPDGNRYINERKYSKHAGRPGVEVPRRPTLQDQASTF